MPACNELLSTSAITIMQKKLIHLTANIARVIQQINTCTRAMNYSAKEIYIIANVAKLIQQINTCN